MRASRWAMSASPAREGDVAGLGGVVMSVFMFVEVLVVRIEMVSGGQPFGYARKPHMLPGAASHERRADALEVGEVVEVRPER